MQYRRFGKLDWKVSALGFGAMRLPLLDNNPAEVDEPEAIRMIRYAIDHGVNYLDTAYPYHGGNSERIVGRALKDGYREKMKLATKLPVRMCESADDFDRFFNEQMERLDTGKIDFYLLHGLNGRSWPKVRDLGILRWAEEKMAAGLFDYLGYSFHDELDAFKEIVDAYDWTMCQVQYNYMDIETQAGRKGVEYAANKGLAVVVMEPLRGGKLGQQPEPVLKVWESASQKRTPAEWALLWVLNQPEISVALSGMSTMEQVVENVAVASRSVPGMLTAEELSLYGRIQEAYQGLSPIPCTSCGYCLPCPNGVEIPRVFQIYNDAIMYEDMRIGRFYYRGGRLEDGQRADECTECGECVDACPQEIPVPDWLKKVHEELGPRPSK
ncbi:MAG: aldo/keto reductase [Dehalococcoidales bacterium]|nr:MAG: aldo/keto reductase [Dehalococcoidales bacterium]